MAQFDPTQPLVHPLPDPDRVQVRPDLVYAHADGRELAMDVYLPARRAPGTRVPAVSTRATWASTRSGSAWPRSRPGWC